jgi:DNA invertase Pin-like site-specific DNA recombinase
VQQKTCFVNRTNQSTVIKEAINSLLDDGITDKQDIYSKVVDNLGVPRPTVRRVARDLRNELLTKIKILQSETQQTTVPTA